MPSSTSHGGRTSGSSMLWVSLVVAVWLGSIGSCAADKKFSFSVYHRFSDPVKELLSGVDGMTVPEKGTAEYYRAMVHRDRAMHHGRRLSVVDDDRTPLTFANGNDTLRIPSLGSLIFANVSVGTPSLSFLVALDTGSDLFWLPCDCIRCFNNSLRTGDGQKIDLNIYSPKASSTSSVVPCNSTSCGKKERSICPGGAGQCPYQVIYATNGTSSTGVLVEDVLHLITNDDQEKVVDAKITFGCGRIQTGSFLEGNAPNGLLGLGMTNMSVPSILAREGLISNSFSMCFGPDGVGRISFGDKGGSDQSETPFNLGHSYPFYNISITGVNVGGTALDLELTAIFDSGTSFTHLNGLAYTMISESFSSHTKEKRIPSNPYIPFEYCYELSPNQSSIEIPTINLTMKGGDRFSIQGPVAFISINDTFIYCLAMLRGEVDDINIIGQNFMTGYRIIFDRERMMLGWKESDCYGANGTSLIAIPPASSPAPAPAPVPVPTPSPAPAFGPEETTRTGNGSQTPGSDPPTSTGSWNSSLSIYLLAILLFPILAVF